MRISDASLLRITRVALRTLEDVVAQADAGVVQPTWGVRLALDWLLAIGAAEPWQARSFLEVMSAPIRDWTNPAADHCIRATMLHGALEKWHNNLRFERAHGVVRRGWERRYAYDLLDSGVDEGNAPAMCNRYIPGDRQAVLNPFGAVQRREFNVGPEIVHPKDPGWVVRLDGGERVLEQMTWGFPVVLTGKKGQKLKPKAVNNARFDKLGGFWKHWTYPANRCLIPTTRYAEAVGPTGAMTTTWLSLKSAAVFAWAGLWRASDEWGDVYTGVMTSAASELAYIHDRSPVILAPEDWETWLTAPVEELKRFDRPWPAGDLQVEATQVLWRSGGNPKAFGAF